MNPSDFEPQPAHGEGADLFEQPALFYLSNQETIDDLYRLHKEVIRTADQWFHTIIRDRLAAVAHERGLRTFRENDPYSYPHLLIAPPAEGSPTIGLGIAWSQTAILPSTYPPYVLVWRADSVTGRLAEAEFLRQGGDGFRVAEGLKTDPGGWPAYRAMQYETNWWQDLDAYADKLVGEVERWLDAVADALIAASTVLAPPSTG